MSFCALSEKEKSFLVGNRAIKYNIKYKCTVIIKRQITPYKKGKRPEKMLEKKRYMND